MATTKFYLDLRGKAKDGKGSVLITLYHRETTTTIKTGIRIHPENWDKQRVINLSGSSAINVKLQEQKATIDKVIAVLSLQDNFDFLTAPELKALVLGNKLKINCHLISSVFQEYIETGDLKENTKDIYYTTLKKILCFSGAHFNIESINLKWLRAFDNFLSQSQGANGKAIYLRCLRAICNYARQNNYQVQYPFDNFKIKYEETIKKNISIELLRKLYHYPTTDTNIRYRDYFFLIFYLIGINTKDLLLAKKAQVVNGRLEYIRAKTAKHYSIKIEPEAAELLEKYKGKDEFLLEALDHCQHYKNFARAINEALQSIGPTTERFTTNKENALIYTQRMLQVQPLIPEITTYYARHTWATIAHEIGISSDVISLALGHSPTNRTTFIYIKPDISKVDEANRKVIDYFIHQ